MEDEMVKENVQQIMEINMAEKRKMELCAQKSNKTMTVEM